MSAPANAWAGARALVVDDDPAVRDYVATLLGRHGVKTDVAADGQEGEQMLRSGGYHLLLLDLDLPRFSGKFVLELMKRGKAARPNWVVVMSGSANIANKVGDDWTRLGVTDFLTKPFGAPDLQRLLDRAMERMQGVPPGTPPAPVLLAGEGPWRDALAKLVKRSSGLAGTARTPDEALRGLISKPAAMVIGPPFDDPKVMQTAVLARDKSPTTEIIVATERPDDLAIRQDLLKIGVVRIIAVPKGLAWLAGEIVRVARLVPKARAQAPLGKPILLRGPDTVQSGEGMEIFEGGLMGLFPVEALPRPPLVCDFELPGEDRLVEATVEIEWQDPKPDGLRAGLRIVGMSEIDQERVQNFLLLHDRST